MRPDPSPIPHDWPVTDQPLEPRERPEETPDDAPADTSSADTVAEPAEPAPEPAHEPASSAQPQPAAAPAERRLVRPQDDRVIAGVCSGLGRYLGVDPVLVRIAAVVLAIVFVAGAVTALTA